MPANGPVALATEVTLETLLLALCHHLHARLVSPDGRQDRQGRRNLHQSLRPLRSRPRSAQASFIADEVVLGDEDMRRGWMTLARCAPASSVFVGNDAGGAAGRRHPDRRADRHQVEAAGQRTTCSRATPGSARRRSSCPRARRFDTRRQLDLQAARAAKKFGRAVFEALHTSLADDAVHHLRHHRGRSTCCSRRLERARLGRCSCCFIACAIAISMRHDAAWSSRVKWLMMGVYQAP